MRYLLDSDILIAAKNLHYRPSFCLGFWEWVENGNLADKIFSIDYVYHELQVSDDSDFLKTWSQEKNANDGFFLSTENCLTQWGNIAKWAGSKGYKESAIDKFLSPNAADAWLIAFALSKKQANEYTIVTNEVSAPLSKNSIKLPDAAHAMGVPVIKLYDLLSLHAENYFSFKI